MPSMPTATATATTTTTTTTATAAAAAVTTYLSDLSAFTRFLAAYIHTLLYLRALYPRASFNRARLYNTPVYQSRHPLVREWIRDAVTAVQRQVLSGTIARIAIVVYHSDPALKAANSASIMEKYMLDVSSFPLLSEDTRNSIMESHDLDITQIYQNIREAYEEDSNHLHGSQDRGNGNSSGDDVHDNRNCCHDRDDDENDGEDGEGDVYKDGEDNKNSVSDSDSNGDSDIDEDKEGHMYDESEDSASEHQSDADTNPEANYGRFVDLTEQFCAAFVNLTSRCAQLDPLPQKCSFNVSMELKDKAHAYPPLARPQSWIPAQPNPQKTTSEKAERLHPGDTKVTPVRAVEAGAFRFETWIEEGKAKFDMLEHIKRGSSTLGGK